MQSPRSAVASWRVSALDASIAHVSLQMNSFISATNIFYFVASKLVMMLFPEGKLARMNGILQSFTGLGMLMGPIMGSLLFKLGGF